MAYSRWTTSPWYCFWRDCKEKDKNKQILCLWYNLDSCKDWTYEQLYCFNLTFIEEQYNCTRAEAIEALSYVDVFMDEVDREYSQ